MILWHGVELVGCTRKSKGPILNGCIYVVQDVDSKTVTLRLHEDYQVATKYDKPQIRATLEPFVPEVEELLKYHPRTPANLARVASEKWKSELKRWIGRGVAVRWQAFAHIFNKTFELYGNNLRLREEGDEEEGDPDAPDIVRLSHAETCASLRMTYALCYYSAQGTTIRRKHVVLFDSYKKHFTLRHLNVGLSRATHGCYVHVPNVQQENILLSKAARTLE